MNSKPPGEVSSHPVSLLAASRPARLRWSEIIEHLLQTATAATFRVATLVVPAVASHGVRQRITLPGTLLVCGGADSRLGCGSGAIR